MQENEQVNLTRPERIKVAVDFVRKARAILKDAGANHAAAYVARALKSVEGAHRHAMALEMNDRCQTGEISDGS